MIVFQKALQHSLPMPARLKQQEPPRKIMYCAPESISGTSHSTGDSEMNRTRASSGAYDKVGEKTVTMHDIPSERE